MTTDEELSDLKTSDVKLARELISDLKNPYAKIKGLRELLNISHQTAKVLLFDEKTLELHYPHLLKEKNYVI